MSDELGAPTLYLPKKNVVLDATVLTSLMHCARFSDLRFNRNFELISGKSNNLECGSIAHKFLEIYYKAQIDGVKRQDAIGYGLAAAEMYIQGCRHCTDFVPTPNKPKPECGHIPNDYPGVKNTPAESEGYMVGWKWVLTTCEQYAEYYKNDHWVPLETEVVKGDIIYEDDEIRVLWKAKLDFIADTNQGIFPIDHKTMKQNRDTVSLNNQFMGQCRVMKTRQMIINKVGFQKTLEPKDKFKRPVMSYSAARLHEWQSEIVPYYAKLLIMYQETGYYPPNFSNCEGKFGLCQFAKVCEANPEMREEELVTSFKVGNDWNPTNNLNGDD